MIGRLYFILCFVTGTCVFSNYLLSQNQVVLNLQTFQQGLPKLDEQNVAKGSQFILIINNQTNFNNLPVELSFSLRGNGITLTSNENLAGKSVTVPAFSNKVLYSRDLAQYFDIENLNFSGFSKEDYRNGVPLPQGLYTLCFEAKAYSSDANYTPKSACVNLLSQLMDPPIIITPKNREQVDIDLPYLFSWQPRHFFTGLTEYEFEIYEDNNLPINELINNYNPVYSVKTYRQSILLDNSTRRLNKDTRYVCVVKVLQGEQYIPFKNNGYSEEIYFQTTQKAKSRSSNNGMCETPSGTIFINEIANGQELNNDEFVELVVVGSDVEGEYVNLENYIIDDNNFDNAEVGTENGHIRLGECFNNVRKGTIILLYSDYPGSLHPNINPANDGYNPATGVYQLPITNECIKLYKTCPDHQLDDTTYICDQYLLRDQLQWKHYLPMRNSMDVMQVRDTNKLLQHALLWVTHDYSYYNSYKVIFKNQNVGNTFLAFTSGNNWYLKENYTFGLYEDATPGQPNSADNAALIDLIKNSSGAQPSFSISCSQINNFNGAKAKIDITGSPGPYEVTLNGQTFVTTANPVISSTLSPGFYPISVQDTITKCIAFCDLTITCTTVGDSCNDYNDCTINDVFNADCVCMGEPLLEVTFDTIPVYGADSTCNYCFFYDTCEYSAYFINNITYQDLNGVIDTLNQDDNTTLGFHFPYCFNGGTTNPSFPGCGNNATIFDFVDDLNHFFTLGIIEGSAYFGEAVGCQALRSANQSRNECDWNTGITIISPAIFLHANTTYYNSYNNGFDIWDNIGWQYNCISEIDSFNIVANLECDSLSYLWSNGSTNSSITLDSWVLVIV